MRTMLPLIEGLSFETRSIIIVGVMFCLSYTRGYAIRRFFNKKVSEMIHIEYDEINDKAKLEMREDINLV